MRIDQLPSESRAYRAGLRAGDLVLRLEGTTLASADALAEALAKPAGERKEITLDFLGAGEALRVRVP